MGNGEKVVKILYRGKKKGTLLRLDSFGYIFILPVPTESIY